MDKKEKKNKYLIFLTLSLIEFKHFVYSTAAFSKLAALKNASPASFILSLGSNLETVKRSKMECKNKIMVLRMSVMMLLGMEINQE